MTKISIYLLLILGGCMATPAVAQNLNWARMNDQRHISNVQFGLDNGVLLSLAHGYQLPTALPVVVAFEHSQPAGKKVFDDFKEKASVQLQVLKKGDFYVSTKVGGVFRRYENTLVRMVNFGSDLSAQLGFYRSKWFGALELGFDKAIVTNFKHTSVYKQDFPQVKDGWYQPGTGGNFYYGLHGGLSFTRCDIYLEMGKVITQDFKTAPTLPFYGNIGVNWRYRQ